MEKSELKKMVLLFIGCLMLSTSALSASPDSHKRSTVKVDEIKRKSNSSGQSGKNRKPSYRQSDILGGTMEKKLIDGIDKTIRFLKKTANDLPSGSGARLEMLERILNLTLEQATYVAGEEQDIYDLRWKEWDSKGRKGREPFLDHSRSDEKWKHVYAYSRMIAKEYPSGRHTDQVTYNGAIALTFLGQESKAVREYLRIIKMFPSSPVAGDAHFSVGDYYFDRNKFSKALQHYRASIKFRRSQRYGWALFKLAWCYYNLGQYKQALNGWKKTIIYSDRSGDKSGQRLKEEAMRDMVFAYAELRQTEEAIQFYRKHGAEEFISRLLKLLAQTLSDQGKFSTAVNIWKKLLALYPDSEEAFDAQTEIVALTYEEKNYRSLWNEIEVLMKRYHPGSRWAQSLEKNDRERVAEAQKTIRKLLLYYPKMVHKEAQKKNDSMGYRYAKYGYQIFLRAYPKGYEVPEVMEYLADLEYFSGNYQEAGKLYLSIAMMGKDKAVTYTEDHKVRENIHQRSAKNMLDAYNKDLIPEMKVLLKLNPDFRKPERSLSQKAKNFISGCGYYIKWYPEDTKTAKNCEIFISDIYYKTQNKDMALKYLWMIAEKYAGQKEGYIAADNLIPVYQYDKKELYIAVNRLLSMPAYSSGKFGQKLLNLIRGMEVENIAQESSAIKRAKLYESRAMKHPKDKDADKFWNNAAVDYLKSGSVQNAMNAFRSMIRLYPSSLLYGPALLQLGQLSESTADYAEAARYYLGFARRFPKEASTAGALQRACLIQIATQPADATRTCIDFARRFPAGGALALEKLTQALWRQKDFGTMKKVLLNEYLGRFSLNAGQKIIAYYRIYSADKGRGAQAQAAATEIMKAAGSGAGVSGEALRYVGEIAFQQVQPLQQRFTNLRLSGSDVNQFQASIEGIFGALVQLEQAYGQVFRSGDAYWGVAAFAQLAYAYESFAIQLENPPDITGVQRKDLLAQLKASVDQVQAKAKELYSGGIQTARKFSIMSEWSVRIFDGINRVLKRNMSFDEWVSTPDFVGSEVSEPIRSGLL